jgi:hypothetical protein
VSATRTAKKSRRCGTSGHTIAKNRHIRVFRLGSPDLYSASACVLPRGRVRHLGDYENDGGGEWDGVYGFQLAGDFVAYEDAICDRTDCTGSVKSLNVVTREMAHRARIPLAAFLTVVHPRHRMFFRLLAATGLRVSEAIALQRRHLHLDGSKPHVKVRRARVKGRMEPPKTRYGKRNVPLDPALVRELREHLAASE